MCFSFHRSCLWTEAGHAHITSCACVWLPIYRLSHVCFIAHAHVVRKCSARTVSKRVYASSCRVDQATRRATVDEPEGFLEDNGRNDKKGSPLALYVNTAVQYAQWVYLVLQVMEDSRRRLRNGEYVI